MTIDHTILMAHGSRDPLWAQPFEALHEAVLKDLPAEHPTTLAYMELSEPTLDQAVASAVEAGAKSIAILPLFFAAGRHLREDVPAMIQELEKQLPVSLTLLPPVGSHPSFFNAVADIIQDSIKESGS
ncbi:CbiX/SirB N-terminal domain-containing protein [Allohahella marinimesophila]|uniref:CbiX/SirB N-terminal domain-containing protein n=1 Tax=Allohahella marinimesophila TaxID=1054972 RepID=A0ABP7NPE2_9GAMM